MRQILVYLFISLTLLLFANLAAAQSTCAVPVDSYITSATGEPLNTSIDVEINFYLSDDADALAVDCRSASEVPVSRGWMRLMLDACSLPPDDGSGCGTSTLQEIFTASDATGDTVHVGIRVADDPDELSPNSRGKMWCDICWEEIEDFKERKKLEYEAKGWKQVDEMLRENIIDKNDLN